MTEVGDDTQPAMCYPKQPQYKQWKGRADEMGYESVSRFMIEMIEAGHKQLDIAVAYDEDTMELRKQRNDLKRELDEARDRLRQLENQLYRGERRTILDFLENEGEATFPEIVQHVINDAPSRVARIIDEMDGDDIAVDDGRYRVAERDNER